MFGVSAESGMSGEKSTTDLGGGQERETGAKLEFQGETAIVRNDHICLPVAP